MEVKLTNDGYWNIDNLPVQKRGTESGPQTLDANVEYIQIENQIFYLKEYEEYEDYLEKDEYGEGINVMSELNNKVIWYNHILLPAILKQIQVEHADYFLGVEKQKKYIISPTFLQDHEKLLVGDDILEYDFVFKERHIRINERLEKIGEYLQTKGKDTDEIAKFQLEHLKQVFAAKLIGMVDFHTVNWGMIENDTGNIVKTAPFWDYSDACYQIKDDKMNYVPENKWKIEDFIQYYKDFPGFMEFVENAIEKFDLQKAFEDSYKRTKCKIDPECIKHYHSFLKKEWLYSKIQYNK